MQIDFNLTLLLLVFMRMSGCILFSPIFGRRTIPVMVKTGLSLILTIAVYPLVADKSVAVASVIVLMVFAVKELIIGFMLGFIANMFMSVIILGGGVIDLEIGFGMANVYDPSSNISMPVSASVFNIMYMLIFFSSNAHLTLINIIAQSGIVIPYGSAEINAEAFANISRLFSKILIYAVQMTMPVLAAALITEMAVGLLMKAVPQINIFIVNIQLKVIIGLIVILIMVQPMSSFLERLINLMFDSMNSIINILA